ncbi:hypothetical protein JET18_05015 [Chryseobacterium sp. L7]|uniref:Lipoprotein n=1 Tax=Chryseobacterium endalhagicum TaxID=2797638 RepID=A0ABS1QD11_9FLAO|nr:hypothetical protein [Chryseobacterium endalhagicum]MBL1220187.1 hypothetical protein [Chryseobacterium endalhagicum]
MKNYKAIVLMLILAFSLSPCSVKRDVLGIFDIQHISGLNKVKITTGAACELSNQTSSSRTATSKSDVKLTNKSFHFNWNTSLSSQTSASTLNSYSGKTSGNSPPKYILFKRLKLHIA